METLSRSWDLLGQSFAILKSDKELMWLPIISALFCIMATVTVFGTGLIWVLPPGVPIPHDPVAQKELTRQMAPFVFLFYIFTYSVSTYFNVALVSIAADRLAGGKATLNDGLQIAWQRKWSIFQWALLSATVGMVIQALEQKFGFLGRIVIRTIGVAWVLASFFVVPLLAAQDMGPVDALFKSGRIFRKTWGEQVTGGFSFGLVFMLLALPGILLPIMGARMGQMGMLAGLAVAVLYWLLLGVINSAARGIFVAALYRYATTEKISPGFSRTDFTGAWQPKLPRY